MSEVGAMAMNNLRGSQNAYVDIRAYAKQYQWLIDKQIRVYSCPFVVQKKTLRSE